MKCWNFHTLDGGTFLVMAMGNRRTDGSVCLGTICHPRQTRYILNVTACLWAMYLWRSCSRGCGCVPDNAEWYHFVKCPLLNLFYVLSSYFTSSQHVNCCIYIGYLLSKHLCSCGLVFHPHNHSVSPQTVNHCFKVARL